MTWENDALRWLTLGKDEVDPDENEVVGHSGVLRRCQCKLHSAWLTVEGAHGDKANQRAEAEEVKSGAKCNKKTHRPIG